MGAVENARTIKTINVNASFEQIFDRGRWDIAQFARDFLDIDLHEGQQKWMHTNPWADERFLASGNRWGKTASASVKLLHHCLYQTRHLKYASMTDRYIAINLSITLDMANIAWDFAFTRALDSRLYRKFVIEDQCKRTPFPTMVIGSGGKGRSTWRSELWARSTAKKGKYLLGKDFDFVNYDEAARDPDGPAVRDDVLMMRLADRNGRIDYTSTGNLKNWYYEEFLRAQKSKSQNLYAQTGSSYENPHIDHGKLKRNEARLSEEFALQNIYGGFASSTAIFTVEDIQNCYRDQDYKLPVPPQKNGEYIMGIDWGRKEDETVILVARIDRKPRQLVYAHAMGGANVKWDDIYNEVANTYRKYGKPFALVDSTSMGGDIHLEALRNNYAMENVEGYNFGGTTSRKQDLITAGQRAIQERWFVFPYIAELYDQLLFYQLDDKKLKTDWVMAFCLTAMAHQKETWFTDGIVEDEVITVATTDKVPGLTDDLSGPWERLANNHYGEAA